MAFCPKGCVPNVSKTQCAAKLEWWSFWQRCCPKLDDLKLTHVQYLLSTVDYWFVLLTVKPFHYKYDKFPPLKGLILYNLFSSITVLKTNYCLIGCRVQPAAPNENSNFMFNKHNEEFWCFYFISKSPCFSFFGNVGQNLNGKVRFGFFRSESDSGSPLEVVHLFRLEYSDRNSPFHFWQAGSLLYISSLM